MSVLRALLALVLHTYPSDFRKEYGIDVFDDFDHANNLRYRLYVIGDAFGAALVMRADLLWGDLRYALRTLAKAPLFTSIVVGTLALAIAGNAIAFTILSGVLLKPLPFAHADRYGVIYGSLGPYELVSLQVGGPQDRALNAVPSLDAVTRASVDDATLQDDLETRSISRTTISPNFFTMFGVHPQIGRLFAPASALGDARDVVISDAVWHRDYAGAPDVLGKRVKLDDVVYTVIGVAPAGFFNPIYGASRGAGAWTLASSGVATYAMPIARVKDGTSIATASADVARVLRSVKGPGVLPVQVVARSIQDVLFGDARTFLWMVYLAATGVLVIACANVANLLVGRSAARDGEFALRRSLGATPRRLGAQLFTEMFVLASAGALIGIGLTWWMLPSLTGLIPETFPRVEAVHLDASVLVYVLAVVVTVTILAGLVPALSRTRNLRAPSSRYV